MVLFEQIDSNKVTILEPDEKRNYEVVDLQNLLNSIIVRGKENGGGFYLIDKK